MSRLVSTRATTPYSRATAEASRLRYGMKFTPFYIGGRRYEAPPRAILTTGTWNGVDSIPFIVGCEPRSMFHHATLTCIGPELDETHDVELDEVHYCPLPTLGEYFAILIVYDINGGYSKAVVRFQSLAQVLGAMRMRFDSDFELESGNSKYRSTPVLIPDPATYVVPGSGARRITVRVRAACERFGNPTATQVESTQFVKVGGAPLSGNFDRYFMDHISGATTTRYWLNATTANNNSRLQWMESFHVDTQAGDTLQFNFTANDGLTRARTIALPPPLQIADANPPQVITDYNSLFADGETPPWYENAMQCELIGIDQL